MYKHVLESSAFLFYCSYYKLYVQEFLNIYYVHKNNKTLNHSLFYNYLFFGF